MEMYVQIFLWIRRHNKILGKQLFWWHEIKNSCMVLNPMFCANLMGKNLNYFANEIENILLILVQTEHVNTTGKSFRSGVRLLFFC